MQRHSGTLIKKCGRHGYVKVDGINQNAFISRDSMNNSEDWRELKVGMHLYFWLEETREFQTPLTATSASAAPQNLPYDENRCAMKFKEVRQTNMASAVGPSVRGARRILPAKILRR